MEYSAIKNQYAVFWLTELSSKDKLHPKLCFVLKDIQSEVSDFHTSVQELSEMLMA